MLWIQLLFSIPTKLLTCQKTTMLSFPFSILLGTGLDIESSLKQLAERRTDIFGVEETAIGKKIGEEEIQKPEEKVQFQ